MKTKLSLLQILSCIVLLALRPAPPALSQIPQGFNYQAIARDGTTGNPITNQSLPARITIQSDSLSGTIFWQEIHGSAATNDFGMLSLVIGKGTRQTASTAPTFNAINWSVTPKFIMTEIDQGSGFELMGSSRLWSVPYAMYAPTNNPWLLNGSSLYYASGFVGIETSTPVTPLTVTYNDNTGITYPLYIQNASGDWTATEKGVGLKFGRINPTSGHDYGTIRGTIASASGGDGRLQFIGGGGSDPHMTINHLGNVGIGTTTPDKILTVKSYSTNTQIAKFADDARYIGLGRDEIGSYDLSGNIATLFLNGGKLTIASTGAVGIGNVNPGFALDVQGRSRIRAGGGSAGIWYNNAANNDLRAFTGMYNDDNVGFYGPVSGWGFVMNVNNGNVGIGTISPSNKLEVNGQAVINGNLIAANSIRGGGYSCGASLSGFNMEIGGASPTSTNGIATLWLHHHGAIAHQLRYTAGTLYFEAAGNGYGTNQTPILQVNGPLYAAVAGGKVGIGTTTSTSKVAIQPEGTWDDNIPLFEVKNKYGIPVLAVYNNGVKINIEHDPDGVKGVKGGFAIGGYDYTKGGTVNLMNVTPDSIRFNINNDNVKGPKGGFAIGGFDITGKGDINQDFMYITPQSSNNGQFNTFIGYETGKHTTAIGVGNTFIGHHAGYSATDGWSNILIGRTAGYHVTIGSHNTLIGSSSGETITSGSGNILLGNQAGYQTNGNYNVSIGWLSGYSTTGSGNVFLGCLAGFHETGSDKLYIENTDNSKPLIWGDFANDKLVVNGNSTDNILQYTFFVVGRAGGSYGWNSLSDARFKKDITTIDDALNKVMNLRGVYFNWIDPARSEEQQMGFIAQEAVETIPQAVYKSNGYYSMDYASITALTVEAIKEQQGIIEKQQQQIERLEKIIQELMEK